MLKQELGCACCERVWLGGMALLCAEGLGLALDEICEGTVLSRWVLRVSLCTST